MSYRGEASEKIGYLHRYSTLFPIDPQYMGIPVYANDNSFALYIEQALYHPGLTMNTCFVLAE